MNLEVFVQTLFKVQPIPEGKKSFPYRNISLDWLLVRWLGSGAKEFRSDTYEVPNRSPEIRSRGVVPIPEHRLPGWKKVKEKVSRTIVVVLS
jgi:hypothetical protein